MGMPRRPTDRSFQEHVFTAPDGQCRVCGRELIVWYRRGRHLECLDGMHLLLMRDKRCPDERCSGHRTIFRPPEELRMALKKDVMGLDVVLEIGELRLGENLAFAEIHRRLKGRVPIAERTVADVFERFLALTCCRAGESPAVRKRLREQGGMVVMIDGVQYDDHSPVLYVVSDVLSGVTLFGERHADRSAKALEALLRRVAAMNVPLIAIVSDKEKGLVPAIRAVFPEVPHQLCQLHFVKQCARPLEGPLAALGAEVKRSAERLRALRRRPERAAVGAESAGAAADRGLVQDLLEQAHAASKASGRAPFEPPALVRHERLQAVARAAEEALREASRRQGAHRPPSAASQPR
jgi:hypothetical protein